MKSKISSKFEKLEDKKILEESQSQIMGGPAADPPYSNETGDTDCTTTGGGQADCADYANGETDFFTDGYIR